MARPIDLSNDVRKFLDGLDAKQFRQIARKVFALGENATPNDCELVQGTHYRHVTIGEYRIVYHFDEQAVHIVLIERRGDDDVYKKLKRKK